MTALTLYDITVPVFIGHLKSLSLILAKASKHSKASTLPAARLVADMRPLTFQIQTCSDACKGLVHRLTGAPLVSIADDEKTFDDMQERIAKTLKILESAKREDFDGKEDTIIDLRGKKMKAKDYVVEAVVPNFYFHYTTAYDILRAQGVEIGKQHYLGTKKPEE